MGKSETVLKFRPIVRPKHTEEISGDEAAIHQPWEIMMMVKPSEFAPDAAYPVYYYIRAQKPDHAAMMAHQLWQQWEKVDKGREYHRYPDVDDMGAGRGIDEAEFQTKWKEAQNASHRFLGMRANPSAFTMMKPGYDGFKEQKIVVPVRRGEAGTPIKSPWAGRDPNAGGLL